MTELVTEDIKLAFKNLVDQRFYDQLFNVLNYSQFIKQTFASYSQSIVKLTESGDLTNSYADGQLFEKVSQITCGISAQAELEQKLRQIRHIEMSRIAVRELVGVADIEESMRDLTFLADALVTAATTKHLDWLIQRYGNPVSEQDGETSGFVVFAMGKLGGKELNFSSDIDLIFTYSHSGVTSGKNSISNNEFFLKLGQALINTLNNTTVDGFVYRVDMRLRPNGQSGPLVMSFSAMENYYQIHGREWERYAWIKARAIAGDKELGGLFLLQLRPFVYRKYLDYQVYGSLEEMKEMINKEIHQQGMQKNIKLGRGGIREIEFIAQSHQLVRGGREPELRTRSLKNTLFTLAVLGQIDEKIARNLYQAYLFLREVEHRLQMQSDQQTHTIPDGQNERNELANSFGLELDKFEQKLASMRDFVHNEFNRLHRDRQTDKTEDDWQLLWQYVDTDSQQTQPNQNHELVDPLKAYTRSKSYRALESNGRRVVERLIPKILRLVTKTEEPLQSLNRVLNVISAIGGRTAYLSLLDQFPVACKQLIELCACSAWISQWIARHPIVLDTLINPRTDQYLFNNQELKQQVIRRIDHESDIELKHDILRQIHHSSLLQIAIAEIQHQYEVEQIREFISGIAEIIVNQVVVLCQRELEPKFGLPQSKSSVEYFGVIAYGKLGSKELSYNADLDLVFLYDDTVLQEQTQSGEKTVRIDYYFSRLVQRIITMLNMQTSAGKLYDVDTRLRPSGQSGLLVSSLTQFSKYQHEQAWTWEHQALVKARFISDAPALNDKFEQLRAQILTIKRPENKLKEEIVAMRQRMHSVAQHKQGLSEKIDPGGMIDVEFISQFFVLNYACRYNEIYKCRSVKQIIRFAAAEQLLEQKQAELLFTAYSNMLKIENQYKLHKSINKSDSLLLKSSMKKIRKLWNKVFE